MGKITELDLADAQLTGFAQARSNEGSIVELINGMNLSKTEWEKLKKEGRTRVNQYDFEEIEAHFAK